MRNISVVIAEEEEYAKRLARYMVQHEPCIQPCWYVDKEGIRAHLCGQEADLILLGMEFVEEAFLQELRELIKSGRILLLTDEALEPGYREYPVIRKLQPADAIIRQIYGILTEEAEDLTIQAGRVQELTGVFAPWNLELSMLFARALAAIQAKEQRVLMITLQECYGLTQEDETSGGADIIDVMTALRMAPKNPGAVLHHALQTDGSIDYFLPADNPGNLFELTGEDYRVLLDTIGGQLEQEKLVWEMPYLTPGCDEWISRCQKIYCPYQNGLFLPAMREKLGHVLDLYGIRRYEQKFSFFKIPSMHLTGAGGASMKQLLWSELGMYIRDQLWREQTGDDRQQEEWE